ncbi:flavin reductase family protein [Agromyces larvae]|uniref:Flavin reductase family protein n=1 Tax=Agromyces larvae TaxID=2929802 RepID=A0ABY4BU78_9MICO|nr:flavin reductase family protein [Agromyces larvae]UOE42762.1 flavin reductase family protein [Agromyces larvae]
MLVNDQCGRAGTGQSQQGYREQADMKGVVAMGVTDVAVDTTIDVAVAEIDEPGLDSTRFKLAFRNHAAGVAVVTADPGSGPVALTATSVFSVSAEPPLLVFSLSRMSSSTPFILAAETVVVHLLRSEDLALARLCSMSGADRFADTTAWERLDTGEPRFHSAHTWVRGRIVHLLDAGGSVVVVVHALEASTPGESDAESVHPLVYHNRQWHELSEISRIGE